jgi:hypothetical protein
VNDEIEGFFAGFFCRLILQDSSFFCRHVLFFFMTTLIVVSNTIVEPSHLSDCRQLLLEMQASLTELLTQQELSLLLVPSV